ncbi:winged helix-turn-helix transcriptional regulator [Enterococcus sp. MJM12]|uniref:Winged helix-turn-helix transcriptional regulator n=1 Tax=Candidatus Enterococcus myersii TaxID=2815322 RepID=A0ABS3HBU4_9ENTE|nr:MULTISPECIES: MarR family winged helix-turn-helix transcriptional regulator [Enterococcus]MBO0450078.1 winged helix-turn-helix transcriptional regulator [Enterococcus sp. MJM12]MDT2739328.1 MarR family winged helix-turn-helix transcriptional regulator [Enterococcus canintestini]WHA09772.1 MarR family winged helix-turn-helix transcriptional regulator [Enterococcus montenegrensis]
MLKSDSISEKIYQISNLQQNFVAQSLKYLELNPIQARSLNYIAQHPGTIQKNLAGYLEKPNATVTNILKSLEKADFIKRKIPVENERQKQLFLTAAGERVIGEVEQIFAQLNALVELELTAKEIDSLNQVLPKVASVFSKEKS